MLFSELPTALRVYCIVVSALLGAVLGSFLNCAAFRVARKQSFVSGHSRCPSCGHELGALDLVPVFSWLLLGGKCRYCRAKISPRYLLVELLFAALSVCCVWRFGLTVLALRNWVFLGCLLMLSLVDLEICEIPDGCLITAAAAYFAALPFLWNGWLDLALHVAAGLVCGGAILGVSLLLERVLKKETMGGGDIKLFAVAGLYLGFLPTLFAVILSCFIGLLQAYLTDKGSGKTFPFGPSIAAATTIMLFFGEPFAAWYLGLF